MYQSIASDATQSTIYSLFTVNAQAKGPPHLNIKHSKLWWSDGTMQSFKTRYGTPHLRKEMEGYSGKTQYYPAQ